MAAVSKGPLNYSTVIEPLKSAGECTAILVMHGATAIGTTYSEGQPTGLRFVINTAYGPMSYSLPINVTGTHKALLAAWRKNKIPQSKTSEEQARRVAWRVLKDWIELQLALIEAGVAEFEQVMLPYMHVDGSDQTLWEKFNERQGRLMLEEV